MTRKVVNSPEFSGFNMSLAQLFGSGPMFTITCGECGAVFKKRIQMVSHPRVICPYCDTVNIIRVNIS